MKYAVLETGGKQYIAREGETIEIDRLPTEVGKPVAFKEVLLVVDDGEVKVGAPYVKGAQIKGTVVAEVKAPKVIVFKFIPKERYRRKQGHRQRYTRIAINSISVRAPRAKAKAVEAEKEPKKAKPPTKAKPKKTTTPKSKTTTAKPKTTTTKPKTTTAKPKTTTTKSKTTTKTSRTTKSSPSRTSKTSTSKRKSSSSGSGKGSRSKKSEE
ncbi:MAG: 50S ribosomal protein L21 [Anaerolineales bacterium]|nr:50S ribosomal protein L21 [Anaerolineales bacterium]